MMAAPKHKVVVSAYPKRSASFRCAAAMVMLPCLSAGIAAAQVTVTRPMPSTVTVHVASNGTERVPDMIFGSFIEPIGNSINNGIAAEILLQI
jgi:alpha-N-arabinofuranosidase